MNTIRTYSELLKLHSFDERLEYLRLKSTVALDTFGRDRYVNQKFYRSREWKQLRNYIIVRDNSCDLGVNGYDIVEGEPIYIHHMNPIKLDDIVHSTEYLMNPEYLITTTHSTHNIIHYGLNKVTREVVERTKYDTCPWKEGANGKQHS